MTPDDPRHGSTAGYQAHRRSGVEPCAPCRTAAADYERKRSNDQYLRRPRRVPAIGITRRVRALQALGWSMDTIAVEGGWKDRDSIWYFVQSGTATCNRRTAERVEDVYRRLSMTPGPSRITAARAKKAGWPPPLAWDDIDNPDETPNLGTIKRTHAGRPATNDALVEDAEFLADDGLNLTNALERLGVARDALHQACRRAGRPEVYARLARRESRSGEISVGVREALKKRGAA